VAVALGFGAAPSALADVTITPAEAIQGDQASLTFRVTNDRPAVHTVRVEVDLPPDAPVAEVYPMSVPDWAPSIVYRKASAPLPGIHESGLTTATSAVVWTRAGDAASPPAAETLRLEMGPLPSVDRFVFTVVQTYSDGTVRRWRGPSSGAAGQPAGPGTVLTLKPDPASAGAGGAAAAAAGGGSPAGDTPVVNPVSVVAISGVALGFVALLLRVSRRRRRSVGAE
jgi:uncharacterized protein YcnI